jgi:prevent-host-death family protein
LTCARTGRMYILYMPSEMRLEMSVTEAREALGPVTSRVEYGGETVYLTKHGRRAAALVPAAAAELLEELEDAFDLEAVRAALAAVASGEDIAEPFVRRTPARDSRVG